MKATEDIQIEFFNKIGRRLREFDEKHGWIDYFIAPVIVTVILLAVYAIKGVYPFGLNTISYYDMPASYIPIYSFAWDALHGVGGIYLNWYCGLAVSMSDVVGNFLFFPTNLFFLFTSRDGILYAMSFFLLIKYVLCSLSMSIYFKKHYPNVTLTVCASILYTFSGFTLQYYTNIYFLDIVIMLPLIVYAFERMLKEQKYNMYIILMFFVFFLNVQLVFMLGIYLIFKGYFILKDVNEEMKGKSIRLFVISTIIAASMSCFILFPSINQTLQSSRKELNEGFDYIGVMKDVYIIFRKQKHMMLYGSEVAVGLLGIILTKGKEIVRKYYNNIVLIIILGIPILHEGINRLWHIGSYKHFPMRFAYIFTFECLVFVGEYLNSDRLLVNRVIGKASKLLSVASLPFVAYVLFEFFKQFCEAGISDLTPYGSYWVYLLTVSVVYALIFVIETEQTRKATMICMVLIQAFCGGFGLIAPHISDDGSARNIFTKNSIELRKTLSSELNCGERIKADPSEYESNYAMVTKQPSISSWLYGLSAETENELLYNMGYDGLPSYLMDSGGTVFTDAFLGVTRVAASENPDELLYEYSGFQSVYNCKYRIPFGIVVDSIKDDENTLFVYQNNLFKSITGLNTDLIDYSDANEFVKNEKILTDIELEEVRENFGVSINNENSLDEKKDDAEINEVVNNEDEIKEYRIEILVEKLSTLYMTVDKEFSGSLEILVNEKPISMESFSTMGCYTYPNELRNGMVALGTFSDETAEIKLYSANKDIEHVYIGILDIATLEKGINQIKENQNLKAFFNKRGMIIKGDVNKEGDLLFPIGFSDNWKAKVNGSVVDTIPYINNAFLAVHVPKGQVEIEFKYLPRGLTTGVIISIIGVFMTVVLNLVDKYGSIKEKYRRVLDRIFVMGYKVVFTILIILFYIVPIYIKMSL